MKSFFVRQFDLRKLLTRALTILILAPIIIWVVLTPDPLPFFIIILLVSFLCLQESYQMFNLKHEQLHDIFYFGYLFSALLLLSVFMQEIRYVWENYLFLIMAFLTVAFFIFELVKQRNYFINNASLYCARSVLYIGLMFSYALLLKNHGAGYCIYLISVVWTNDIFAYLIGIPLGKHKLSPKVSPKKSIEGAVGAAFGAILMSANMRYLIPGMTLFESICLGLSISIFAQIGDLVESLLKRSLKVKDSGNILPGHGGMLDRIDSFLLTLPVFYYFVYYFVK